MTWRQSNVSTTNEDVCLSVMCRMPFVIHKASFLLKILVFELRVITSLLGRVKRIWYLSPMRAAKVQASLRSRAVSPEPPLLAQTGIESRGTFRQKARSLAPLKGWACAVTICHDGMLEDTNSLDGALLMTGKLKCFAKPGVWQKRPLKHFNDTLHDTKYSKIKVIYFLLHLSILLKQTTSAIKLKKE